MEERKGELNRLENGESLTMGMSVRVALLPPNGIVA
jgi:hypothetical protein